ncbi:ComEC/Rec2 family competence protein [Isoptericola sp. S6320L]|uniref:ComEC/Rec2 family competence protein n=1 Tax=Isoptericola sp. S6320L TaxID=2926411 RepID=UPI001FF3C1BB|nr:ComEC/Rec2 family competence protein [Isoptericola sp. S6320L]MCK0117505.1 ComEC/Rec2 family competence protein [Isoptericola sp. S6320L]
MTQDLRLAPAALVVWAAAWCLSGAATDGVVVLSVGVGGAVVALGSLVVLRRSGRAVVAHLLLVGACLVALAGSVHGQAAARAPLPQLAADGAVATLRGTVVTEPRPATFGDGHRWQVAVTQVWARGTGSSARGHVEVTAPGPPPRYGAVVVADVRLGPPGIGAGTAASASATAVRVTAPPGPVLRATTVLRAELLEVTEGLSPQARGLVPGAAVGDTTRLPDDLDEAMRTTGLTHVTAVSGSHFAIVVATLTVACAVLRLPRAARVVLLVVGAVGFVLLVRPEPSVLRAAWTCSVTLLALALGRPAAGPPALAVASTVLLVVDPWMSRSFGFALSCAATAGIILLTGPIARRLDPWCGRVLAFAVAVPLAAQSACGPLLVLLDPALPATAVPANLLAAPALVPATVLGLVATLLAPWAPAVAFAVAWVAGVATAWIAAVARFFAALPGASLPWPGGVGGALLLAAGTTAVLWAALRRPPARGPVRTPGRAPGALLAAAWRRAAASGRRARPARGLLVGALSVVLLAGGALLVTAGPRLAPGLVPGGMPDDWQVVACDVGQGDTLAIRSGARAAVVVDVGPPGDAAARCLERLGVERIDLLVLSHFHTDHVGGLDAVLAGRPVRAAVVSPLDDPAAPAGRARGALADAGVPVSAGTTGQRGAAGTVTYQVLAADPAPGGGAGAANDASVALALRTGSGIDVVALGDLEEPGQERLVGLLAPSGLPDGPVEVLKMAHHGSASQSADLARLLAPRVTLVPVGENDYGHPTSSALALYAAVGSRIVRTDECGTSALTVREGGLELTCARRS